MAERIIESVFLHEHRQQTWTAGDKLWLLSEWRGETSFLNRLRPLSRRQGWQVDLLLVLEHQSNQWLEHSVYEAHWDTIQ